MNELPRCKRCNGPILPTKKRSGPIKVYCTKQCQTQGTYLQRKEQGKIKPRKGG